jgi:hypothetical protein
MFQARAIRGGREKNAPFLLKVDETAVKPLTVKQRTNATLQAGVQKPRPSPPYQQL